MTPTENNFIREMRRVMRVYRVELIESSESDSGWAFADEKDEIFLQVDENLADELEEK